MHLVFVFTFDYELLTWDSSGQINRELNYFNELKSQVFKKITIVTYGDNNDLKYLSKFKNIEILPIYTLTKKPNIKILRYLKSFFYPFLIKKNIKFGPNVIIRQHQLNGSWVSIILKFITRSKLVIRTGYDMYSFSIYSKKNIVIRFLYFLLTQFALIFSNVYTVTSETDKVFLEKNFFTRKKIFLIPNWAKIMNIRGVEKRVDSTLLSIGRIEEQKNLFYLIDLIEDSNFKLLHIGDGSLRKSLEEYARLKKVKLEIIRYVDNNEVYEVLRKHLFFISTSRYEGNSKTILEALGSGCVVFASDIPNNKELIKDGYNGFLIDISRKFDNQKINKLISNKKFIKEIQNNAINKINTDYSLTKIIELEKKLINNFYSSKSN